MRKHLRSKNSIIDPKAQIGKNVKIGDYAKISANVVIEDDVVIGDWCKIGFDDALNEKTIIKQNPYYKKFLISKNKCIIKRGTTVSDGAHIFNKVIVEKNSFIGNNTFIRSNSRLGTRVVNGFNVYIGPFAEIGDGSMILNYSTVGSTSKIGKNVFIGPSVVLVENKYMLIRNYKKRKGPIIEDYVRIGCLSAIISCHIGKFSVIGANSVVTKDLPEGSVYFQGVKRKIKELEKKEYLNSLRS